MGLRSRWSLSCYSRPKDLSCPRVVSGLALHRLCGCYEGPPLPGVVPDRNKRATQNTLIQPWQKKEPANYRVFLSAFLLVLVTFSWVFYYIYRFQAVLPDYQWDVHEVCKSYVVSITSGKARLGRSRKAFVSTGEAPAGRKRPQGFGGMAVAAAQWLENMCLCLGTRPTDHTF